MLIYIEGHSNSTPLMEIAHAMTGEKVLITENPASADVLSVLENTAEGRKITTTIKYENAFHTHSLLHTPLQGRDDKQSKLDGVKLCYYSLASKLYKKTLPWGCITGIRPAKMAAAYLNENGVDQFAKDLYVSPEKAELAIKVAQHQKQIASTVNTDHMGMYIGIPFCPTRCLYCSFVSLPMDKQKKYVQPYVDHLCKEIEYTGNILNDLNKKAGTIYIGGGTPTSVNENQLNMILQAVCQHLKSEATIEFTVEAGRPDTINREKLEIMKNAGISRISINPQTLNDNILVNIGRNHTSEDFITAFHLARDIGFDNINTDVIAGLPGEDYDQFISSLNRLIELSPDAITLHTMCIKRAATLKGRIKDEITYSPLKMVNSANKLLEQSGYMPYYMYRQKDTLDDLENTGYAKKSHECVYNILMMEDMGSVIGIGAGSVTKVINQKTNQIERIFNLKDANEYVKNFDEILNRKTKLKNKLQTLKE